MTIKNKIDYVAQGAMTFIIATRNQHHVDLLDLYKHLQKLIGEQINQLEAADPNRNR